MSTLTSVTTITTITTSTTASSTSTTATTTSTTARKLDVRFSLVNFDDVFILNLFFIELPVSLVATVTASNYYSSAGSATSQGDSLVDRTTGGSGFSAGGYAPQYVQLELPGLYNISLVCLQVGQSPNGVTRHQLSVGASVSSLSLVTDMNNYTSSGQWINLTYSPVLTNVRFLRLDTLSSPSWVAWIKFIVYDL